MKIGALFLKGIHFRLFASNTISNYTVFIFMCVCYAFVFVFITFGNTIMKHLQLHHWEESSTVPILDINYRNNLKQRMKMFKLIHTFTELPIILPTSFFQITQLPVHLTLPINLPKRSSKLVEYFNLNLIHVFQFA